MKIRISFLAIPLAAFVLSSCNRATPDVELKTQNDTVSYWMGLLLANNLKEDGFESPNTDILAKAFDDVFNEGELLFDLTEAQALMREYYDEMNEERLLEEFKDNKLAGELFLEQNKSKEGVVTLPSGLQYKVITEGNGPKPELTDMVKVHYKGSFVDGNVFESSYDSDPVVFRVDGVIPGWTEILQIMNVGSTWEVYIPQELGYGANVRPGGVIQPFSALVFEIKLIAIEEQ